MTQVPTIEELEAQGIEVYVYNDGSYEWKDQKGFMHLVINGVDLLEGCNASECLYCGNEFYYWKDQDRLADEDKVNLTEELEK